MRQFVRHTTDTPVRLKNAANRPRFDSDCNMKNIGQGGVSCEVDQKFSVGDQLAIEIPFVSPPFEGHTEVIWCHQIGQHYEVGMSFIDREKACKARMVQQVCQIEHYKNRVFETEGRMINGKQVVTEWIEKYPHSRQLN